MTRRGQFFRCRYEVKIRVAVDTKTIAPVSSSRRWQWNWIPSCKRPVHGVPAAGDEPPPSGIVTCQVYVLADSLGRSSAGPDDLPKEEIAAEAGSVSPGVADTTAWPSSVRA
jgi:hypothetical protein